MSLFVSFESESEREKERVERGWSKGTSKGPVRSFVLSRRLSKGGAVLVSKAFESQVLSLDAFPLFFFFPSLLTDFRGERGKKDGRKSAEEVNGTEENPHRTH